MPAAAEPSGVENLVMASAFISGMGLIVLIVVLTLIIRANRQEQALEMWLSRELTRVHEAGDSLRRQILAMQQQISGLYGSVPQNNSQGLMTIANQPAKLPQNGYQYQSSPYAPPRRSETPPSRERSITTEARQLLRLVNETLAGAHPYNIEETIQANHPRLNLLRMSMRGSPDAWSSAVILEPGGESFFALVEQSQACLYPNDEQFGSAHDPRFLFEGARTDAKIHQVQKPAILSRTSDGAWQLVDKGRVQMR